MKLRGKPVDLWEFLDHMSGMRAGMERRAQAAEQETKALRADNEMLRGEVAKGVDVVREQQDELEKLRGSFREVSNKLVHAREMWANEQRLREEESKGLSELRDWFCTKSGDLQSFKDSATLCGAIRSYVERLEQSPQHEDRTEEFLKLRHELADALASYNGKVFECGQLRDALERAQVALRDKTDEAKALGEELETCVRLIGSAKGPLSEDVAKLVEMAREGHDGHMKLTREVSHLHAELAKKEKLYQAEKEERLRVLARAQTGKKKSARKKARR